MTTAQSNPPGLFSRTCSRLAEWLALVPAPKPAKPVRTVKCGLPAVAIFLPDTFTKNIQPKAYESVVAPANFSPNRVTIHETIVATFVGKDAEGNELDDLDRTWENENGADVILRKLHADGREIFPFADEHDNGLSGAELANINGWPRILAGEELAATFTIDESVMARIVSDELPSGYEKEPESITVQIRMRLEGPQS